MALVAGCSGSGASQDDRETWVSDTWAPHSQLVAAGDLVVYYSAGKDRVLNLVALDPTTGEVAWSVPNDPSRRIQGTSVAPAATKQLVYGFDVPPAGAGRAFLAAWDVETGEKKWVTDVGERTNGEITLCGEAVCVKRFAATGLQVVRFDSKTGAALDGARQIGEPVLAEDPSGALVSTSRATAVVWATPANTETPAWQASPAALFASTPVHPDFGWGGGRVDGGWILWLGGQNDAGAVAGVDDAGGVRWQRAGVAPCAQFGSFLAGIAESVVCNDADGSREDAIRANVVGLDPVTGQDLWTLAAVGAEESAAGQRPVRVDEKKYLVSTAAGRFLLTATTAPEPVKGDPPAGWCLPPTTWDMLVSPTLATTEDYAVAPFYAPCGGTGTPLTDAPKSVPAFAGPTVAGWSLWVQDRKVHGVQKG